MTNAPRQSIKTPMTLRAIPPLALAAALGAGLAAAPARAEWTVCNETSYVLQVAIAYDEAGRRVTEGWTRLRPSDCKAVRRGPLAEGEHYLYARSSRAHRGGLREWSGEAKLCVDSTDFSLAGEASCEDVGFETRSFIAIDIDDREWRTRLREPVSPLAPLTLDTARLAGIQRLLRDNGYDVKEVDGLPGRRTDRALRKFLDTIGRRDTPKDEEILDLLEDAALKKADEAGLKICNRGEAQLWTAIAQRRGDGWESRGWWPLGGGECARVIDQPLAAAAYYVYAGLREGERERTLAAGEEIFCLAATKFAILGRENCETRGYSQGPFLTVLSQGRDTVTVELKEADFGAAPRGPLRP